jgi:hypothetical protein
LTFVGVSTSHPLAFLVVGVYVIVWLAFDVVLGKALRVLPGTKLLKPVSDLLLRGSAAGLSGSCLFTPLSVRLPPHVRQEAVRASGS